MALQFTRPNFIHHLQSAGMLNNEQKDELLNKCNEVNEKKLLFETSNYFSNFTASDWFDMVLRIYTQWLDLVGEIESESVEVVEFEPQEKELKIDLGSSQPQNQQSPTTKKQQSQTNSYGRQGTDEKTQASSNMDSVKSSQVSLTKERALESSPKATNAEDYAKYVENKLGNLVKIINKLGLKRGSRQLKDHHYYQKMILNQYTVPRAQTPNILLSPKDMRTPSPRKTQGDPNYYQKLYNDFQKQQDSISFKRQAQRLEIYEDCTFSPKTNPVNKKNLNLTNRLNKPVHNRLAEVKPLSQEVQKHSQKERELKGATFHPDISPSQKQRSGRSPQARSLSPTDQQYMTFEKLYSDHDSIQKTLMLKKAFIDAQDAQKNALTNPRVLSPHKSRAFFAQMGMKDSVNRLYGRNLEKQRNMIKKEVEFREKELEECSFTPNRMSKPINKNNATNPNDILFRDDIPVHERLYEKGRQSATQQSTYSTHQTKGSTMVNPLSQSAGGFYSPEKTIDSNNKKKAARASYKNNNPSESPEQAYERLYKHSVTKNLRMNKLKERLDEENGMTFQPKVNKKCPVNSSSTTNLLATSSTKKAGKSQSNFNSPTKTGSLHQSYRSAQASNF